MSCPSVVHASFVTIREFESFESRTSDHMRNCFYRSTTRGELCERKVIVKIVVLVKDVPDTYGERTLNLETGLAERDKSDRVIDEIVERGLEFAISYAEHNEGTEVVALSMATEQSTATVRKALAMGADRAVLVVDEALNGADITLTAHVLAAALNHIGFDLIVAGDQSTDGVGGVIPSALAELLDIPQLTRLASIELTPDKVSGPRTSERVTLTLAAPLPAIVSVTERFPPPRLANFKGIMSAKKKPFEVMSLRDLNAPIDVTSAPRSIMIDIAAKPPRHGGVKVIADGDTAKNLVEFLKKNQLV
jgi:electron transfer flavoprotein beta subunit